MSNYRPFESGTDTEEDVSGYTDYTDSGSDTEGSDFMPPDRAELYRIGNPKITAKALDNTIVTNTNYSAFKKSGADEPLFGATEINFGKTEFKMASKACGLFIAKSAKTLRLMSTLPLWIAPIN